MKPSHVIKAIECCARAARPIMLLGQPGVGKTSLMQQAAEAMGRRLFVSRLALAEPVDMRGLPTVENGATRWLTPHDFPKASDGPVLWFFDEWSQGLPSVQNAAGQILRERRIGDYVLPDTVYIAGASNRAKDRAATHKMPGHIADRWTFVSVDFDLLDWTRFMLSAGAPLEVVAFGQWRPELLCQYDPNADKSPTPRSWEEVGDLLRAGPCAAIERELYEGKVGHAAALEFCGFLSVYRTLPDIDAVLMNPDTTDVPHGKPATMYALTGALARRATEENFDRVLRYGKRMGGDFCVALVRSAVARTPDVTRARAFKTWSAENAEVMI